MTLALAWIKLAMGGTRRLRTRETTLPSVMKSQIDLTL